MNADTTVSRPLWNNDWDGAALVLGDYLLEGGENSWFYVVKINRGYDDTGKVTVDPHDRRHDPGLRRAVAVRRRRRGGLHRELRRVPRRHRVLRELGRPGAGMGHLGPAGRRDEVPPGVPLLDGRRHRRVHRDRRRGVPLRRQRVPAVQRTEPAPRPAHEARPIEARRPHRVVDPGDGDRVRGSGRQLVDAGAERRLRVLHDRRRTRDGGRPPQRRHRVGAGYRLAGDRVAGGRGRCVDPGRLHRGVVRLGRLVAAEEAEAAVEDAVRRLRGVDARRCGTAGCTWGPASVRSTASPIRPASSPSQTRTGRTAPAAGSCARSPIRPRPPAGRRSPTTRINRRLAALPTPSAANPAITPATNPPTWARQSMPSTSQREDGVDDDERDCASGAAPRRSPGGGAGSCR